MVSEKERENREKLFRLMQENPELPVVAMVDRVLSERYGDDYYADMTGKQGAEAYAGLPWIKAIIVYIDLP